MDFLTLLQQVCQYNQWGMAQQYDGAIRVEIPTEYGRSQVVEVIQGRDPDGRPLVYYWTVVVSVQEVGDPWFLLGLNADLPYGALAVRGNEVILIESQLMETADAEEVMRGIFYVGKYADQFEKQVRGQLDAN
ncbi:YbjN domain-containing protein [Myxococcota bacterium]|nr:YbjN domain-containing protein [Myxococcota bacterium]MBU1429085.1 YbjN domain-containing protein [Myxococcota bacterium]MBU1900076.1 YbjN domain-containing protein [Myxococcota bacterium]